MSDWMLRINNAIGEHERNWRTEARDAVEVYRRANARHSFNVLWPNTELKRSATFSRAPKPVVRPRFGRDDTPQKISLMLERALEYQIDIQPYENIINAVVLDWLLPGRGVSRVRYIPRMREYEDDVFEDDAGNYMSRSGVLLGNDEIIVRDTEVRHVVSEVMSEEAPIEHVSWTQFTHDPQDRWEDVEWVAFHHRIVKEDAVKAFGSRRAATLSPVDDRDRSSGATDGHPYTDDRYSVWEVWDRRKMKVRYVAQAGVTDDSVLEEYEDPYGLQGFFPVAEPLRSVITPGTTLPVCEYSLYREQAHELNVVTTSLKRILRQVRPKGTYDASQPELGKVARADDQVLVPVENWAAFSGSGGFSGSVDWWPIDKFAGAAAVLSQQREQLLDTIYQITGLSDILRGSTAASETATAQQLKAQFGSLRLRPLQMQLQRHIVSMMEMQVELMAEKFEIATLEAMTGVEAPPGTEQVIRSDLRRQFHIDVETDSTLAIDDQTAKQERAEFLNAFGSVLGQAAQAQAAGFLDGAAIGQVLKFALQPYRISRELEDVIEQIGQAGQGQQGGQAGQPDAAAQAKAMEAQARIQLDTAELQHRAAKDAASMQLDTAKEAHRQEMDREKLFLEALRVAG